MMARKRRDGLIWAVVGALFLLGGRLFGKGTGCFSLLSIWKKERTIIKCTWYGACQTIFKDEYFGTVESPTGRLNTMQRNGPRGWDGAAAVRADAKELGWCWDRDAVLDLPPTGIPLPGPIPVPWPF